MLDDLIDEFLHGFEGNTLRCYRKHLEDFKEYGNLVDFILGMKMKGLSKKTRETELNTVKAFFKFHRLDPWDDVA